MNGIHEVTGSIPVWSTKFLSIPVSIPFLSSAHSNRGGCGSSTITPRSHIKKNATVTLPPPITEARARRAVTHRHRVDALALNTSISADVLLAARAGRSIRPRGAACSRFIRVEGGHMANETKPNILANRDALYPDGTV